MNRLYDKTGREIIIGDVLKVFHFTGSRRKKHFMYKQVVGRYLTKDSKTPYLKLSHLDTSGDWYSEREDGRKVEGMEIVQGAFDSHEDRVKI